MNGKDDVLVPPKGVIATYRHTKKSIVGLPPSLYSVWNYASLNEKASPTYTTRLKEFKHR
jgi:hypothetical protein